MEAAADRYSKDAKSLQGPHGVPSSKTVDSFKELLQGLNTLKENLMGLNLGEYVEHVNVKSLTTLPNEHLHSLLRQQYAMPMQLQLSHSLIPVIEESLKKISNCGFKYFTNRTSYYEVPNSAIHFEDFPIVKNPPSVKMSSVNKGLMNRFVKEDGESVK